MWLLLLAVGTFMMAGAVQEYVDDSPPIIICQTVVFTGGLAVFARGVFMAVVG